MGKTEFLSRWEAKRNLLKEKPIGLFEELSVWLLKFVHIDCQITIANSVVASGKMHIL